MSNDYQIMKKLHLILLAILTGILLSLSWPARGFPFLLFLSFVPLLYIEDYIAKNKHNFVKSGVFFYSYIAFFIWNAITTWWIIYSTVFGAVMAVVVNALFMAIVFHIYHLVRRTVFKSRGGYYVLIFFWICFEYLHLNWDLSWSWLNLGNGFAAFPEVIQWYEITGSFGGAVWILLGNILLYKFLLNAVGKFKSRRKSVLYGLAFLAFLAVPLGVSLTLYYTYNEKHVPVECVVVQPNIDPYNEKFDAMSPQQQLDKILKLARKEITPSTDFLVCPETAMPHGIVEDELNLCPETDSLKNLIRDFPQLKIVIGMSSYKVFRQGEKLSATVRYYEPENYWYDVCNTSLYLDSCFVPQFYHKSKLVPGVEKMPFPKLLKPLEKFALDLGGMTGSHGVQSERSVQGPMNGSLKIAPVICYESIYGDFVTGYIRNGATLIFIITNDGWWENTAGHRQHLQYARIRAIENRRSIARSANTGISAFINQRGDILAKSEWWTDDVMKMKINANACKTFYTRFGDYIGLISLYTSLTVILIHIALMLLNKRKKIRFQKKTAAQ